LNKSFFELNLAIGLRTLPRTALSQLIDPATGGIHRAIGGLF